MCCALCRSETKRSENQVYFFTFFAFFTFIRLFLLFSLFFAYFSFRYDFFTSFSLILPSFSLQIFGVSHRSQSCEIKLFFRFKAKRNFRFNFKFRFRSESEGAPYTEQFTLKVQFQEIVSYRCPLTGGSPAQHPPSDQTDLQTRRSYFKGTVSRDCQLQVFVEGEGEQGVHQLSTHHQVRKTCKHGAVTLTGLFQEIVSYRCP
jgi:hypothetical protein